MMVQSPDRSESSGSSPLTRLGATRALVVAGALAVEVVAGARAVEVVAGGVVGAEVVD